MNTYLDTCHLPGNQSTYKHVEARHNNVDWHLYYKSTSELFISVGVERRENCGGKRALTDYAVMTGWPGTKYKYGK